MKVGAILIEGPEDATKAPSHVKIFANVNNFDFGNAESTPATQDFILTEDDVKKGKGKQLQL